MQTKKTVPLHVSYKDLQYLKDFMTPHSRIVGKRRSAVPAKHQRMVATALKRARFMALLPYVT
ncbi:MAG: ribosomal protein, partial [Candidatus Parcubacteria bacterium]